MRGILIEIKHRIAERVIVWTIYTRAERFGWWIWHRWGCLRSPWESER